MSLLAWYPLINDYKNYGLVDGLDFSNNLPTYTEGKTGGRAHSGSYTYSWTAAQTAKVLKHTFSYCCWFKVINTTNRNVIFGNDGMGGAGNSNNRHYAIMQYPTANDLHCSWQIDATSSAQGVTVISDLWNGFFPTGQWVHLAITYGNGEFKLYRNGSLYKEKSNININPSTITTFAYQTTVFRTNSSAVMNDVRIYDHVLSAKEVQEISRGLVCHYKMDEIGGMHSNRNLIHGTDQPRVASGWSINGWGGSFVKNSSYPRTFTFTTNNGWSVTKYKLDSSYAGKTVTISFWARPSGSTTATDDYHLWLCNSTGTNPYYNNAGSGNLTIADANGTSVTPTTKKPGTGTWVKYKATCVLNSDRQIGIGAFCAPENSGLKSIWYIRDLKIELGDEMTEWSPSSVDTMYTNLGYDSTIKDVSGNGFDATVLSTLPRISNSSNVYENSIKIDATSRKIRLPVITTSAFANSYTFAWWEYFNGTATTNNMPWGFADGNRLNPYHANNYLFCNTGDSTANAFVNNTIPISMLSNSWHHIAMTGNGSSVKLYVDGVFQGSAQTNKNLTGTQIYINGWSSADEYSLPVGSMMNDFRIYSTALDDNAIKEIAQVRETIDNRANIYGHMLKEHYYTFENKAVTKTELTSKSAICTPKLIEDFGIGCFYKSRTFTDDNLGFIDPTWFKPGTGTNVCGAESGYMNITKYGADIQYRAIVGVEWKGGFAAVSGQTLNIYFQGTQCVDGTYGWTTSNQLATKLNNSKTLVSLITSSASGFYEYNIPWTIASDVRNATGYQLRIRSDYSSGTGQIRINYVYIMPDKYYTDNKAKIMSEGAINVRSIYEN